MIKTELCNYLIENGLVVPYQVIRHNYSNHRLREDCGRYGFVNICPTLDTRCDCLGVVVPCLPGFGAGGGGKEMKVLEGLRIRKLTPKECWRLMGFADEDFHKAEAVNSNTQLYKQAGNSIVVNCIEEILINLFKKG